MVNFIFNISEAPTADLFANNSFLLLHPSQHKAARRLVSAWYSEKRAIQARWTYRKSIFIKNSATNQHSASRKLAKVDVPTATTPFGSLSCDIISNKQADRSLPG